MHQISSQQWNELEGSLKNKFQEAINVHYEDDEYPEYRDLLTFLDQFDDEDEYVFERVAEGVQEAVDETGIDAVWEKVKAKLKAE